MSVCSLRRVLYPVQDLFGETTFIIQKARGDEKEGRGIKKQRNRESTKLSMDVVLERDKIIAHEGRKKSAHDGLIEI